MTIQGPAELFARRLGIDTYREYVVFLRSESTVCRAEGLRALSRVRVACGQREIVASLNIVHGDLIGDRQAGLSESAWVALGAAAGDTVSLSHPEAVESFSAVRRKIYGGRFTGAELDAIVRDLSAGHYSSVETAAFVTACAGDRMSPAETLQLTRAMVDAGTRLAWHQRPVMDKHCVGGLPGNRTTPIVVAIAAAGGLTVPKTSSRAITSPAGTADAMEVLAPVTLTLEHMRRVVEREGGCVVWGGAIALSPADDLLIQVERPLDFDSDAQLAASVISKKVAAGSTHLVVDIPVGPTAKLRSHEAAARLARTLTSLGGAFDLRVECLFTDGSQPVGFGIGPALEALDVLDVLHNAPTACALLRARALQIAARMLEIGGRCVAGEGPARAAHLLASGAAARKFESICDAQGGRREPRRANYRKDIVATQAGAVQAIDNRRLGRVAKLAGAPASPSAGLVLQAQLGQAVVVGQPLYTIHAQSPGELEYAAAYALRNPKILEIGSP
ncbi:thymidine phosphorylase [Panacagrimonas perspica]|uniref:Putative thymidine phosphorylase n=1 Tax=Panacagrimonas perspica TaxID=381431 RepID=A0A4R7PDG4_9GAMM|nr:thymidine phosphorylase family protein [Panacagrimonas perspica]TDU31659.1 thymidine phosphorylase [Panacagrimonas perspica]THD03120.1 thymidine phosphorylase [Panacagrimonas perspica]